MEKKQFVVSWVVSQLHEQWLTVEAESEEEALNKVKAQSPISQAEGSQFLHNGDEEDFQIDDRRTKLAQTKYSPERTEIAENLLVAALEGGSNYWIEKFKFVTVADDPSFARVLSYPDALGAWKNGGAVLVISELDSGEHFHVRPYDVLASAEKSAEGRKLSLLGFHANHDAGDADEVLQLACFSEIIYG